MTILTIKEQQQNPNNNNQPLRTTTTTTTKERTYPVNEYDDVNEFGGDGQDQQHPSTINLRFLHK